MTVVLWVLYGPVDDDGLVGTFVGHMLWWRIWGVMALVTIPPIAGFVALEVWNGTLAVGVTAVMAMLCYTRAMYVSPKYTVGTNY